MIAVQEPVQSTARSALSLWGDYSLADPQFLLLVPVALGLFLWGRARRGRPSASLPVIAAGGPRSMRQRLLWLPGLLHVVALLAVVVALARPLRGHVQSDVTSEGIDIVLAVDRSGSMQHQDLEEGKSRLEVVKGVVGEFAERRMTDRVGASDSVALLSFARFPKLVCPFTLDVDALQGFLGEVELARHREEDGTAIGLALTKAVSVLRESQASSRVVVLLTDGQETIGEIPPREAGELAAEEGVRVYTIYAARFQYEPDPLLGRWVPRDVPPDTGDLEAIAELTEGRFFRATDKSDLEAIYAEIESLERTERTEQRYEETFDLYLWFLLPALAVYALAWLSHATWARRVP